MYGRQAPRTGDGSDGLPPSESWLFAQAVLGKPIPKIVSPDARARAERPQLECFAPTSSVHAESLRQLNSAEAETRRNREILEWAAKISDRAATELQALEAKEAAERDAWQRAEQMAARLNEQWDESKHPRVPKGEPGGGEWTGTSGSHNADQTSARTGPFLTASYRRGQSQVHLVAAGAEAQWPLTGSIARWLPKDMSGATAGARTGAVMGFAGLFKGLQNASMAKYWERVPAIQVMPQTWVYELEKRVKAGKLSHDDAVEIFATGLQGAEAQGFKPSGRTMAEIHKSMMDFLAKAEQVYFARKKERGWATERGGYQKSGGRVFPTKHNSGLDGLALRKEQEDFFRRGIAQGHDPSYLRGQARVAGEGRTGNQPDRLDDPELEAALQRAIEQSQKREK